MFQDFPIKSGFTVKQMKERFDSETNAEFIRFLRYARLSCTEVQTCPPSLSLRRGGRGELYVSLDEEYISSNEFKDVYEQARQTRAAVRGFINYLKKYEERKVTNPEP